MQTVIFGHHMITRYSVDDGRKTIFNPETNKQMRIPDKRPQIKIEYKTNYKEILRYDGEPHYDIFPDSNGEPHGRLGSLFISDNECVDIKYAKFMAHLNEYHLISDKILSTTDINKDKAEEQFKKYLRGYNKAMIKNDDKLLSYCKTHKLNPAETDVDELRKIVEKEAEDNAI